MKSFFKKIFLSIYSSRFFARLRKNKISAPLCVKIKIFGKNNKIIIPKNNRISKCSVKIFGSNSFLEIGENNYFNDISFWFEDNNSKIIVGRDNNFCGNIEIACIEGKTIKIGNDLLVAKNVSIVNGDSHSIVNLAGERQNPSTDISIGNHVWIGKNVSVLKNGSIGSNVIVGANSLL